MSASRPIASDLLRRSGPCGNKNSSMMRQQNAPIARRARPRDMLASAVKRCAEVGPKRLMKCLVGAVVGGFELAVWAMFCIGLVVEAAVGEWSAQTFVEE
jgi:hypothetical protein